MNYKVCNECGEEKPLSEFSKDKNKKDGYSTLCKQCRKNYYLLNCSFILQYQKNKYLKNRKSILINVNRYNEQNKTKILQKRKEFYLKYPWKKFFSYIKSRCNNPKATDYNIYGGRGIKCLITEEELKELWFRDNAWKLKHPSIDRINNDGNYTYDNCQFIEMAENLRKDKRKSILQFDLQGIFVKEWNSIKEISQYFNVSHSAIIANLKNRNKSSCGYIWKYKIKE